MLSYIVFGLILFSFLIFIPNAQFRYIIVMLLTIVTIVVSSVPSIIIINSIGLKEEYFILPLYWYSLTFIIDKLTAFFILLTNFTVLTGLLFSKNYLNPNNYHQNKFELSLHYFFYLWLYYSMLGVLMFREGLSFLISWEFMAVSSFMLILFEADKRTTLKAAVNYIIQMHIGFVFLLIAFLISESSTSIFGFYSLKSFFASNNNVLLFLLFFVGFGIKTGFIPIHTWLPEAHPAAPSHVSGVMSGVMIKMGIYGILRVLLSIQSNFYTIGVIIIMVSIISGLIGVMMAIVQHDLKKLLAYHSIENIGIIGIGMGLGMIGLGNNNNALAILGFSGCFLHILNHSLFKSLLFYSAGMVYKAYKTLYIENLGGIIHKMPFTAFFFLIGAIAICGIPPLNGFISEALIYCGLFSGFDINSIPHNVLILITIIALTIIGGLAVFCFTKAFGVIFLGNTRNSVYNVVNEVGLTSFISQILIIILIFLIGLCPFIFLSPIINIISHSFNISATIRPPITYSIYKLSIISLIFISISIIFYMIRKYILRNRTVTYSPTWGCGYINVTSKQQYTGTSYANNFSEIAAPILQTQIEFKPLQENEIVPTSRVFKTHAVDIFKTPINKLVNYIVTTLKYLARLQTGSVQHYILYAFIYILIIFLMMYLEII